MKFDQPVTFEIDKAKPIGIMGEIDDVIDQYGGWPEAFKTS